MERWWRHLIGGAAAVRFHRPESGLGLSAEAEAAIRAGRKLVTAVKPWEVKPANELLRGRGENEAYLAAEPGSAYALYFTNGGEVELDLREQQGRFELRWINIQNGEWGKSEVVQDGEWRKIAAPGAGHWAGVIMGTY